MSLQTSGSVLSRGNRREFLHLAGAAALGAGLSAGTTPAAERPVRNGKSHLKLSLAAYSLRDYLSGEKATMTMDDFIAKCAEYNLDGCELTSYYFPERDHPVVPAAYQGALLSAGFGHFRHGDRQRLLPTSRRERDENLALTRRWIDYAATFGAPVIRIFAGNVPQGSTEAEALDRCVAGIDESLKYAAEKGVFLAIENHGGITSTADQLLRIVERVQPSPWFGVNFDSGNFQTADPYADMARIAPYAINAQIKTEITVQGTTETGCRPGADRENPPRRRLQGIPGPGIRSQRRSAYSNPAAPRQVAFDPPQLRFFLTSFLISRFQRAALLPRAGEVPSWGRHSCLPPFVSPARRKWSIYTHLSGDCRSSVSLLPSREKGRG